VRDCRAKVARSNITPKPLITPRAALFGEAALAAGVTMQDVINGTLRKGLSDAQWAQIKPSY